MDYDVVIIGAGISGLTAAKELKKQEIERVLLLDFQKDIGGFLSPLFNQPEFHEEKQLLEWAKSYPPYEVWFNSTVIGFFPDETNKEKHELYVQTPNETITLKASIVIIASGSLQQPRESMKIPGSRPLGVMTSLLALKLMSKDYIPGEKMVLFEKNRIDKAVYSILVDDGMDVKKLPYHDNRLIRVEGKEKVISIEVECDSKGTTEKIKCDSVLYSGGRIPCTIFLKQTPIERSSNNEIIVNDIGATSIPGIYALGSCTILGNDDHLHSQQIVKEAILDATKRLKNNQNI
ncbi:NAD(P)/FAD-dependent oxidoreductase [Neobacillus sp. D3-1R]|uniref:NAD(P)/FAD-dependent oxidoreductase n=1 Tax=Neobacillus sp. D3-1R TaxID=3445778 RepID=UPI003F9FA229